ncbi:MAG: tetratricopeptide repeat protein [Planctomycetota bacterium]
MLKPAAPMSMVILLLTGCGGGGGGGAATQDAYQALAAGQIAFAEGRTAEARDALQTAVQAGGLQPDFYCEAVALLGRCEAELGNRQAAARALATLEQGDPDPQRIAALRKLVEQASAADDGNTAR